MLRALFVNGLFFSFLFGDSDYDNWIDSDEEPLIEPDSDWSEHTDSDSDVSLCGSEHTMDWWEAIRSQLLDF